MLEEEYVESLAEFEYDGWAAVLGNHVDEDGLVDYPALIDKRAPLDHFVAVLAEVGPTTRPELFPTRDHELAYYLNAYNACVLFNVIERYPIDSPKDDQVDFFYLTGFLIDGERWNLYDLENDVIRARYEEPRVHFALNCASLGCPKLPAEPFLPETLDEQLEREADRFLQEERNVAVENGELVLSEVFDWFAEDFRPDPVSWILANASDLALPPTVEVRYREWDWTLNDATR